MPLVSNGLEPLQGSTFSWSTRKDVTTPQSMHWVKSPPTLTQTQWSPESHDPTIVKGDHGMEKEVCVAAGQVLAQMHVTDWAETQREDSVLCMVLDWLEAQKKTDLKTILGEHASSEEG